MNPRFIQILVTIGASLVVSNALAAADPANVCAAAKQKATGKKLSGKMNCYAKATKAGVDVDPECLAKVEQKFLAAFAKADSKGGCTTPSDAATVEAVVDACIAAVLPEIVATTTTTAEPTTTTAEPTTTTTLAPEPVPCGVAIYACGDLVDNDGDLLVDSDDPDCLGACDNSENSYHPSIPGLSGAPCAQDCFWDGNSGSGNDDCYWDHRCDPNEVAPDYYPESSQGPTCAYNPGASIAGYTGSCADALNTQSSQCASFCGPAIPNGCDCFGCCELPAGSGTYKWLGSVDGSGNGTCDSASVNDPSKCQPCQVVAACFNSCENCEICIDKLSLPGACGSMQVCPGGSQACGLGSQPGCPAGETCITGCCSAPPQ